MANAALSRKTCPRCGGQFEEAAIFCPLDGTRLDSSEPSLDEYIGNTIAGDVVIKSLAGAGAMGHVYRAHQRGIDRDVAVKILRPEVSGNAQVVQRFHREAKIASKLQHPHVVEVYLTGQLPDGALFIVMEFLEGQSLAQALEQVGGKMPLERALAISLQIADAVGEGHARGIVHRDLKPENVMLVHRAEIADYVKVLDFGIAKVSLGDQSMETQAGLIFGTAKYISPEGAQGTTVGPAGDVYSLATLLYQMLVGRTPFDAEQAVGILIKHIHEPPPDIRSWETGKSIPEPIARAIMENLAKDPKKRAQTGRAFASQISSAARHAHVSISDVGMGARQSVVDLRPSIAVDPTLDEGSHVVAPRAPAVAPAPSVAPPGPVPVPVAKKRWPWLAIVLAFIFGGALTSSVVQYIDNRKDKLHDAFVAKTRRALADSRYVTPPGENVNDLVVSGLKQWPDDPELLQMRSTASIELVTRSMVAQRGGDLSGAKTLATWATELDPTDHFAAIQLKESDDAINTALGPTGNTAGPPLVLFELQPPMTHPSEPVVVTARIFTGAFGARAKVTAVTIGVYDHLDPVHPTPIPVTESSRTEFKSTFKPGKVGNFDLVFTANVDGTNVRAERELTVLAP